VEGKNATRGIHVDTYGVRMSDCASAAKLAVDKSPDWPLTNKESSKTCRCSLCFDWPLLRPHSHCKLSRTEMNWAERVAIHIASRADSNWNQCSWHFWTARMSNHLHVCSLTIFGGEASTI